jgi:hypothetical protein
MLKYFKHKNPRGSSVWFIELRPKLSADKYNNSPEGGRELRKDQICLLISSVRIGASRNKGQPFVHFK